MKSGGDHIKRDGIKYFFRKQVVIWILLPQDAVEAGRISRFRVG